VRSKHDQSRRGGVHGFGSGGGEGGVELSDEGFVEAKRRGDEVFAVGGCVCVAREFEEEDGKWGCGEGGRGERGVVNGLTAR